MLSILKDNKQTFSISRVKGHNSDDFVKEKQNERNEYILGNTIFCACCRDCNR